MIMKILNELSTYRPFPRAQMLTAVIVCAAALSLRAQPETNSPAASGSNATASTPSQTAPAPAADSSDTNLVTMNFHGAPLDQVLTHLSETAGFIINVKPGTFVKGKVDAWSAKPMTKEEALNLLDTALYQNGLGAVRNGRTLTIVKQEEIKTQNNPVMQGSDPEKIPMTDRVVTQIMPVRFVEAGQLVKDLAPLVPLQTVMTANEAGNSIIVTDTQANIHKVAEIVRAIDMGAEEFVEVRVFHLTNSSPVEMAEMLTNLFPDESKTGGTSQSPFMGRLGRFFGGGGGGGGGSPFGGFGGGQGGGQPAGGGSNSQNQRIKKRNRVIAVPDQRTASMIVSATRDLMEQIEDVVRDLDNNAHGKPTVAVFKTEFVQPQELVGALQDIFQPPTTSRNNSQNSTQNNPLQTRSSSQTTSGQTGTTTSRGMGSTTGSRGGGNTGFGGP
jgi:type II secretory pathway component GspD/PulD (secretin)